MVHIIFPVLNESERLTQGVDRTVTFLEEHRIDYQVTIADNGSEEEYWKIAQELAARYGHVQCFHLQERGVGQAVREAFLQNECGIVGYMDVDLSTPLENVLKMQQLFEKKSEVDIVNGSRLAKDARAVGRKPLREITSRGLNFLLRVLFHCKFTDSMCGFKFFRKETAIRLVEASSKDNGWFYCAELLIRAERMGCVIEEIPVIWTDDYRTRVRVVRLIRQYLARIALLFRELVFHGKAA